MSIILLIVLILASIIVLWAVGSFNRLVRLKAMLEEAWSGIDVQLKRRYDLVPNLVAVVKQYSIHEKTVLEEVTRMRSISMHAENLQERATAEAGLTQALKTLFAVAENYPDLKANENFLSLQKSLATIEDDIQLARRYYNGTARNYNILVQTFPSSVIASLANFQKSPYFELAATAERENVQIKF
jgi:LemA protein